MWKLTLLSIMKRNIILQIYTFIYLIQNNMMNENESEWVSEARSTHLPWCPVNLYLNLTLLEIVQFRNLINLTQISLVEKLTKSILQIYTHWQGNERNVMFNKKRDIYTYKTYSKSTVCQKCVIFNGHTSLLIQ